MLINSSIEDAIDDDGDELPMCAVLLTMLLIMVVGVVDIAKLV